ncbi:MAG TPA: ornithine cyclodeaminase family protein [Polyangiales bacterium]|nr:ornithine cyclodeaminase family protein [Polyangiales bacterium]
MSDRSTLLLGHRDVAALADMRTVLDAVERAFAAHARGEARMPSKVYLDLPEFAGDFRAMPSLMGSYAGVKWVNAHPQNAAKFGLPTVMGTYVLSDPATGYPLAILDATLLTALRTGAAAGVATKHLAQLPLTQVGFIGTGVQARYFRDALRVLGAFELLAADANAARAAEFARESQGRAISIAEAAAAPVVCIATPSRTPVITRAMIGPGTHINAMGADGPGKQELDPQILLDARVIIDELEQSTHGGELNVPIAQGLYAEAQIAATLGEVILGTKPGRTSASDITVFDSTGLAIQDVAVAAALYELARQRGVGQSIELVPAR